MKRQKSHGTITLRDIEVVEKYFGARSVSIILNVLACITLVFGTVVSAIVLAEKGNVFYTFVIEHGFSLTDRIILFVFMMVMTLIAGMLLFACSYIVQTLVDTEKNTRRQLKLLWLQNRCSQAEYQGEEEDS